MRISRGNSVRGNVWREFKGDFLWEIFEALYFICLGNSPRECLGGFVRGKFSGRVVVIFRGENVFGKVQGELSGVLDPPCRITSLLRATVTICVFRVNTQTDSF